MSTDTQGRLAVLTSGGDAPGMNAAVRAATLVGLSCGWEVYGVKRGYRGLVDGDFAPLRPADVHNLHREGGTVLGSARCLEFHQRETRDRAREQLTRAGIDGLIVIGGNGSLTGALALSDREEAGESAPRVVGIPASIDNDIGLTSRAIGVDTAMNTIVEACDKIADTASAHDRTFLVEVMGRDCGYLAMASAIAAGADMVLFPEAHRSDDELVDDVVKAVLAVRERPGRSKRVLALKAEGIHMSCQSLKERIDAVLKTRGESVETRITVLGHVVRGGRPSAFDRLLGSRLANVAVRALIAGESGTMIGWMPNTPIPDDIGKRSTIDPYCYALDLGAVLRATQELLEGKSEIARWRSSVFQEIEGVLLL